MKDIILKYRHYHFQTIVAHETVKIGSIISYNRLWKFMEYTINVDFTLKDDPGKIWSGYIGSGGTGIEYDGILYSTVEELDKLMAILERDKLADALDMMPGGTDDR